MLKSISHRIMTHATELAQVTGQNAVVFIAKIHLTSEKKIEMVATQKAFNESKIKDTLEVMATIDSNGNFVD